MNNDAPAVGERMKDADVQASLRTLLSMVNELGDLFAGLHDQVILLKDRVKALEDDA